MASFPRRHPQSAPRPAPCTLYSKLTEERLREHSRRSNAAAPSRYYNGLADHALGPERESMVSGGSTARSILIKIQSWGASCFLNRKDGDGDCAGAGACPSGATKTLPQPSRIPVVQPERKPLRESQPPPASMEARPMRESEPAAAVAVQGKPLREKVARPAKPAPAVAAVAQPPKVSSAAAMAEVYDGYVWAYKFRPRVLTEFICNRDQAEELRQMVIKKQCTHYIFEGPPGVGKQTMVLAFLRDFFGSEQLEMKNELKKIELKGELLSSIVVNVRSSLHHVEVNLSESRGYETHVIVALINESISPLNKSGHCDPNNCQVIVLYEADRLSTDAQHYVGWLMEKYKGCSKFIFCCSDTLKFQTLAEVCKIIKLQPPSDKEIVEVLEFIAKQENIELPHWLAKEIAEKSQHNLRQAIRSFEASWKLNYPFKENQEILTGWEDDIANIAKNIVEEQSPRQLYIIRGKLKKLIEHNVSPDFIFNTLKTELKKRLDDEFQTKFDSLYKEYNFNNGLTLNTEKSQAFSCEEQEYADSNIPDSRKNLHHFMRIEEFTAKFMSVYKSFISKNTGGTN